MTRAVVSLLAMGGTIATAPTAGRATPHHGAADLAGMIEDLPVDIRTSDVRTISSRAVTPADMWTLAEAVRREISAGADGVVITHGTDTLEETAYALALLVDTAVPIVLTGAMRAPHLPGADGPANIVAAVVAALHRPLARYGPVVVFQDEIHVARLVTKQHSTRVAAFSSPSAGPVGFVIENEVELLLGPPPEPDRLTATAPPDVKVELVMAVAGSDGRLVDAIAGDVAGLVVAGTGAGHLSPALAEAVVRSARSGRPTVLTSRCADGPILRRTYGGPGSETHLLGEGVLAARTLSPAKARLRLLFGLSAGLSAGDLFPARTSPTTPYGDEGADRDRIT